MEGDPWAFCIAGDWKTMVLEVEVCNKTATDEVRKLMAVWRTERGKTQ